MSVHENLIEISKSLENLEKQVFMTLKNTAVH